MKEREIINKSSKEYQVLKEEKLENFHFKSFISSMFVSGGGLLASVMNITSGDINKDILAGTLMVGALGISATTFCGIMTEKHRLEKNDLIDEIEKDKIIEKYLYAKDNENLRVEEFEEKEI